MSQPQSQDLTPPSPTRWQCPRCRNVWPIGATRRCLSCVDSQPRGHVEALAVDLAGWQEYRRRRQLADYDAAHADEEAAARRGTDLDQMRYVVKKVDDLAKKDRERPGRGDKAHDCVRDCHYLSECTGINEEMLNMQREDKALERLMRNTSTSDQG